ncbi:MAG: hypothetical protein WCK02_14470 [Bacteroidota bacterium]
MEAQETIVNRTEKLLEHLASKKVDDLNSFTEFAFSEDDDVKKDKRALRREDLTIREN